MSATTPPLHARRVLTRASVVGDFHYGYWFSHVRA